MLVFIPIPKQGNAKECSNYHPVPLISHISKLMLKILQTRLQQYMNCELPDVHRFSKGRFKLDLEKAVEPETKIVNIRWIIEKARELQKIIYFCLIDYAKALVWITTNFGNF